MTRAAVPGSLAQTSLDMQTRSLTGAHVLAVCDPMRSWAGGGLPSGFATAHRRAQRVVRCDRLVGHSQPGQGQGSVLADSEVSGARGARDRSRYCADRLPTAVPCPIREPTRLVRPIAFAVALFVKP